ncbi:MAG: phage tail assembly protein [Bacillota bacterium]
MAEFQTEFDFELPRGYCDKEGILHKRGRMRLATAADEILPLRDPRVQQNPAYVSIILLARVVVTLGSLPAIDTRAIENLFTADLAFLQDLYQKINDIEPPKIKSICPHCNEEVEVPWPFSGE